MTDFCTAPKRLTLNNPTQGMQRGKNGNSTIQRFGVKIVLWSFNSSA